MAGSGAWRQLMSTIDFGFISPVLSFFIYKMAIVFHFILGARSEEG